MTESAAANQVLRILLGGTFTAVTQVLEMSVHPGPFELCCAILAQARDAIIATRLDGTIIYWNAGAERIFGYTAAEMMGRTDNPWLPPEQAQGGAAVIAQLVDGQTVPSFATRRMRKDGTPVDVSVTLSPVRGAGGDVFGVSSFVHEIAATDRQPMARALHAAIVEHSDDGIISKTVDGTILSWNAGAELMFGYSAAEMIGGPMTRLFPQDRLGEEAKLIEQLRCGRKISHFETRRLRKDGVVIDVSVTLSPVRGECGEIVAISKIARDITERRQTRELRDKNQQLERSNRDLEEFAYIASHDLKTPLAGVKTAALWLEEDLSASLPEEPRKMLGLMRSRINRMETLLDDLLTYSRVGRTDVAVGETRVAELFDRIVEVLNPPPHIKVCVDGELPVIVTESAQLEQVLRNLVQNAIKHHDKRVGEVILSARQIGRYIEFTVSDDGPGIAPQFHEKIFQLFQTLKRRDEVEGTGMGLAIVKKLVERHHCGIAVVSRGDGTGTKFRFQWPAAHPGADVQEATDA